MGTREVQGRALAGSGGKFPNGKPLAGGHGWTKLPAWLMIMALGMGGSTAMAESAGKDKAGGYRYLNTLRKAAGMVPLTRHPLLEQAAHNHAVYLTAHRTSGHTQRKGRAQFTGETPGQRALHVRFPHAQVSENVSQEDRGVKESIDGLMGAIYHRLGFLSFDVDLVGLGMVKGRASHRYVYNMALESLTRLCATPPEEARLKGAGRYRIPCGKGVRIKAEAVDALEEAARKRNPRVVLWPPPGARDIPPVFYEESPDPLPDRSFSGYPLSVQFNPALVRQVRLKRFRVFEHRGALRGGKVDPSALHPLASTRLLAEGRDPNNTLTPLEFALFPLDRLEWNTTYQGEAEFLVDGQPETHRWHFTTRDPGAPVVRLARRDEEIPLRSGKAYTLYLPPKHNRPDLTPFRSRHGTGLQADILPLDKSTLRIMLRGEVCDTLDLTTPSHRISLKLAHMDQLAGTHPPEVLYKGCGEFGADFRIAGKNEQLDVHSGSTYRVYLVPRRKGQRPDGVRWSFPKGVKVKFDYLPGDLLAVRVDGEACQTVRFTLNDGCAFNARIAPGNEGGKKEEAPRASANCATP